MTDRSVATSLDTHVALVLGGAGGIGAAVCRRLAGDRVVAVGHRPARREVAEELVNAIVADGGRAILAPGDATTAAGIDASFDHAEQYGTVDALVHCVGGWNFTRLNEIDEADVDASYTLNLRSAVLALAAAHRRMVDGGSVVTVSSAAAPLAPARQVAYAAMKAGVEAATRAAAQELGRRGVRANVVRPGATDTQALHSSTSPKAIEAMSVATVWRRLGEPDDIARVVEWLCSDGSSWLTGTVVDATNGLT